MAFNNTEKELIRQLRYVEKLSYRKIAERVTGSATKESTIRYFLSGDDESVMDDKEKDAAIIDSLSRKAQLYADRLRVERKITRESNRSTAVLEELSEAILEVFEGHRLSALTKTHPRSSKSVGVLQLSDLHFGERIVEISDNVFDTSVIAARLKKFVCRAKEFFKAAGVSSVLVAMTGDLINSDRRLDEIATNAKNRADIIFTAVDILQQLILDLNQDFNVSVASVCGNESRIGKEYGWVNFIASDSFDAIIHNILSRLFEGSSVKFMSIEDPLECVVDVNGVHFLLIHGHNGIANTGKADTEVAKLKAKYATRSVRIDYVILGHIHSSYISDCFARSSGLPGGNGYSDKGLNLCSRSSQNIYIVRDDRSIDGIKIDLQEFDLEVSYTYNEKTEAYKPLNNTPSTVVIQSVLV